MATIRKPLARVVATVMIGGALSLAGAAVAASASAATIGASSHAAQLNLARPNQLPPCSEFPPHCPG